MTSAIQKLNKLITTSTAHWEQGNAPMVCTPCRCKLNEHEEQYPMDTFVKQNDPSIKDNVLDKCLVCLIHGLPCMKCAQLLNGNIGPGHIDHHRSLYKFSNDQYEVAFELGYMDSSINGEELTDSEFVNNMKKWIDNNPECIVKYIEVEL